MALHVDPQQRREAAAKTNDEEAVEPLD